MLQRTVVLFFALVQCGLIWAQVAGSGAGPALPQQEPTLAGDPFDVRTGVYYREYSDLSVQDSIPIDFVRTQRNLDPRSRAFGVGGSTSYDMFIIGDVYKFSWVALVMADGSRATYTRISPGTSYADGVFEDRSDPSEFLGSRISWTGRGWSVKLRDGREYTVQGCGASSKPGQCAVAEIKNAQGERLTIQRDRDGNIVRITSPHGHYVDVKTDGAGRIIHAQNDAGNWIDYRYDGDGRLIRSSNWRLDLQEFQYDSHSNMLVVHEMGPDGQDGGGPYEFTITNRFDPSDRFAGQTVTNGLWSIASYHTDEKGRLRQTDVRDANGTAHFFFDESGSTTREEFWVKKQLRWTLNYVTGPTTHELRKVMLACGVRKVDVPTGLAAHIMKLGDAREPLVTQICSRAVRAKPSAGPKPTVSLSEK